MIYCEGETFTEVYLELLKKVSTQKNDITTSSKGDVYNMGCAIFQIKNDSFRMPLLMCRGYNPFFAIAESAWILLGMNSVDPLSNHIKGYEKYSDDGKTLNGAYGYRLKTYFGCDQVQKAINILKQNKNTRQVVLQLWAVEDLGKASNDIPCNTQVMLKIVENKLNLTVINRSNDLYLGVPYNVFAFYILQQYIANKLNLEIGMQTHFTDSLHLYTRNETQIKDIINTNSNLSYNKVNKFVTNYKWSFYSQDSILQKLISEGFGNIGDKDLDKIAPLELKGKNIEDLENFLKEKNPLEFVALLWHNSYGRCSKASELYRMLLMEYNTMFFESYKYSTKEALIEQANLFAQVNRTISEKVRTVLTEKFIKPEDNDYKLLQAFFLASVVVTLNLETAYPPSYSERLVVFQEAAQKMDLDYGFMTSITPYVEEVCSQVFK